MRFTPRSEKECKELAFSLIDKGTYKAELIYFRDTDDNGNQLKTKTGNEKTEVRLKVWDIQGKEHTLFDILTDHPQMSFKIRHFAEAFGLIDFYEKGELPGHTRIGEMCTIDVGIQKGKPKPAPNPYGEMYPDKNVVLDYVNVDPNSVEVLNKPAAGLTAIPDDDVPF